MVVGVHSGKFTAERVTENIRQAVLRLEVDHPVVNDRHFRIWRAYAVNAWPTLALIDPDGRHVGSHAGEITATLLASTIGAIVADFDSMGKMDRTKLHFQSEVVSQPRGPLAFPGKVLATGGSRLFVSDSNHNRVLSIRVDGLRGQVEEVIGGVAAGFADGEFGEAAFHRPQGLALVGDVLYVADTENHAIRAIDLRSGIVSTVAGTGEQSRGMIRGGLGNTTALNSPWDIISHGGYLYVAMAGSHQIWRLDLASGEIRLHAGAGYESLADGPLTGAFLAQPSGLATDGRYLYFADSESSAIRWADFGAGGDVRTVVGTGLFDFGDVDGGVDSVRLQHPLGLTWYAGKLYVADTYNNKLKVVDPANRTATTFLGTGDAGDRDGDRATFDEPAGVSESQGKLYIADTNNHKIRVAEIATRSVRSLSIQGI